MIGFKVDGEFLDLPPGFSVPIEWESGLFSDEFVLNGISTLPISFPFTAKNKRLLKYFHIIENNLKNVQVDAELWLANNLWCTGQITVGVKGESFDCDFSEITKMALAADTKLSEILKDDLTYIIAPFERWWTICGDYALSGGITMEFRFWVNNEEIIFTTAVTANLVDDVDSMYALVTANAVMNEIFDMQRINDDLNVEELILFTVKNSDTIDNNLNINIELYDGFRFNGPTYGTVPDWPQVQRDAIVAKLLADVNKNYPGADFCFPSIKNVDFYGDKNPVYTGAHKLLNYYNIGYSYNAPGDPNRYSLSPQLYVGYILKRLGVVLDFTHAGSFTDIDNLYNRLIAYNKRAIDMIGSDFKTPSAPQTIYNFWMGKFITGDHAPDATLREFLTSLSKYFGLGLFYRNGVLSLETKKSLLQATALTDWTKKQFRIYDELRGNFTEGFILKYAKDSEDQWLGANVKDMEGPYLGQFTQATLLPVKFVRSGEFLSTELEKKVYRSRIQRVSNILHVVFDYFCEFLHDFTYIKAEKEINTLASQTLNDFFVETGVRRCKVPRIDEQGASYEYDMPNKQAPLRYLLYWGLQFSYESTGGSGESETFDYSTDPDFKYPMAQMDNLGMDNTVLGPYKLRWEDDDGMFANWHKDWMDFLLQTKKLTIRILLSPAELLQVDLRGKIQLGPNQYFIDKISSNIGTNDKQIECLVDLYKI